MSDENKEIRNDIKAPKSTADSSYAAKAVMSEKTLRRPQLRSR